MSLSRYVLGRLVFTTGTCGLIFAGVSNGACVVEDIPACPGRCFEFTVELMSPRDCTDNNGVNFGIPFNDPDQAGYRGEACYISSTISDILEAIDHLSNGGQLSELSPQVRGAYQSAVEAVAANIEAECNTAAAGQCTNAAQVCEGIAADAYEQLVVDETCVLEIGDVELVNLGPGEICESVLDSAGGSGGGVHCTETGDGGGADETAGSDASGSTGAMLEPFGDLDALVSCSPSNRCEVEAELLQHISANFGVFSVEGVTLTMLDRDAPCGPGARIGGLDQGEDAQALADAFDLRNGDVIAQMDAITIVDASDAMSAVGSLLEDPSTTLVLRRPEGLGCTEIALDIQVF